MKAGSPMMWWKQDHPWCDENRITHDDENRITHDVMKWPVDQQLIPGKNKIMWPKHTKKTFGKEAKAEDMFIVIDFMKRTVIFFYEEDWVFTLAKPKPGIDLSLIQWTDCFRTKCSRHSLHVASFEKCDAPGFPHNVLSSGSRIVCPSMTESKQFWVVGGQNRSIASSHADLLITFCQS